jgi:23S rRNA (uracil1939-C5)-methyltransferase
MDRRRPAGCAPLTARPSDRPTVRIERLAGGGDGIGKLEDGRTVFVPRSAAGDLVELVDLRMYQRFARARIGRVIEPGPGRVEPRCAHYDRDRCGGCQLQHLELSRQLAAKRTFIGDALRRLGKLDIADPEVTPGALEFGYRTKVTLARGKGGMLGLHREGEPDRVFALERCELIAPPLQSLWARLRPLQSRLPKTLERLVLRVDRAGAVHLIAETSGQESWTKAGEFHAALGDVTIWWRPEGGSPRVVAGASRDLAGAPRGRTAYPATVFEQVNPAMGDQVRQWAVAQAGEVRGKHCWDLYAGIGETTVLLVEKGATVESVEGDKRAVEQAMKHPGLRTSHFGRAIAGRVEDTLPELRAPDLVITNPPRVGMEPKAVEVLALVRPARLIYVSCDPATLARDVARLGAGWRVASLKGFDLFPQTAHVETVLVLEAA